MSRRDFLMASAFLTAACSSSEHAQITAPSTTSPYVLPDGAVVLFRGDSITASDRSAASTDPNNAPCMGTGYALFVARHLLYTQPNWKALQASTARVAQKAGAIFVPIQAMFDQLASEVSNTYWSPDSTHPTIAGSAVIANRWLKVMGL